jgi:hypothetical protein
VKTKRFSFGGSLLLFLCLSLPGVKSWAWLSDNFALFGSGVPTNVFMASTMTATSVNSTTATGLILTNPQGSGKILKVMRISVAPASLPGGAATFVLVGSTVTAAVTHTTPLTVYNSALGSGVAAVGLADSAATLPNATLLGFIPGGPAASVAASTSFPAFIKDDVYGAINLLPGTCLSVQTLTTAITAGITFVWQEVNQ